MMFFFASLASQKTPSEWPVRQMHMTEAGFVVVAFLCVLLARFAGRIVPYQLFAVIGGIAAGLGLIMPFELAPFFFGARGEIMLASVALILVYPVAIALFIIWFLKVLRPEPD